MTDQRLAPPAITVVTPSFNQGRYLGEAIESVLNQDYPACEHVVVDNCSTDETPEVLAGYSGVATLRPLVEPDRGQSDAMNKGFDLANGDLVVWLNADDFLLPGALRAYAEAYRSHPDGDYFYGNFVFVDAERRALRLVRPLNFDFDITLHYGPYVPSSGAAISRRALNSGLRLDVSHRYNMDRVLQLAMGKAGSRFVYVDAMINAFRVHERNQSAPRGSTDATPARNARQVEEGERAYYRFASRRLQSASAERARRELLRSVHRIRFLMARIVLRRFSVPMRGESL